LIENFQEESNATNSDEAKQNKTKQVLFGWKFEENNNNPFILHQTKHDNDKY